MLSKKVTNRWFHIGMGGFELILNVSRNIPKENGAGGRGGQGNGGGQETRGWLVSDAWLLCLQNQILKIILQFSSVKWSFLFLCLMICNNIHFNWLDEIFSINYTELWGFWSLLCSHSVSLLWGPWLWWVGGQPAKQKTCSSTL